MAHDHILIRALCRVNIVDVKCVGTLKCADSDQNQITQICIDQNPIIFTSRSIASAMIPM